MNWTRIIAAALILALAGAGYFYLEESQPVREDESEREKLFDFKADDITGVAIERPGKETITIEKKEDSGWEITSPIKTPADEGMVSVATRGVSSLESVRKIEKPGAMKDFGLDEPTVVEIKLKDGGSQVVKIGALNPMGQKHYITVGGRDGVFMVMRSSVDEMVKNLYDFRNKKLFRIPKEEVAKLTVRRDEMTIKVVKEKDEGEDRWKLVSPVEADADSAKVERLIDELVITRASGFVEEAAEDYAKYGLDKPEVEVTLSGAKEEAETTLLIGEITEGGGRMARLSDSSTVVRLPGEIYGALPSAADDLRDMALARFDREKIKKITILTEKERTVLVPKKGIGPENDWSIIEPVKDQADDVAVSGFLSGLSEARGLRHVAEAGYDPSEYGFDDPALQINVELEDGERKVNFGLSDDKYYAAAGDGAPVMEVEKAAFEKLNLYTIDLIDKRLFKARSDEVGRIVIERLGQTFDARTAGDEKILTSPVKKNLEENKWTNLVWTTLGLKFKREYKRDAVDPMVTRFDEPSLRISVYKNDGSLVDEVVVGARVEGNGSFYAKRATKDKLYKVDEGFVTGRIIKVLEEVIAE